MTTTIIKTEQLTALTHCENCISADAVVGVTFKDRYEDPEVVVYCGPCCDRVMVLHGYAVESGHYVRA